MDPVELCRRLGEPKTKAIFHELTSDAMKKVLREGKLPTVRLASHTTTRKRNEDWANKVWHAVADKSAVTVAATMLFEWLTRARRPMLATFLDGLGVTHDHGLTDADFMTGTPPEKLVESAKKLLSLYDKQEVAAYLLFLDASNKSEVFKPLELDRYLEAPAQPSA